MGPLIDKPNVDRVNKMVEEAIAAGARVVVRGGPVIEGPLRKGAFYRPTLLETELEAVGLANDSEYGLSASIWSRDLDRPLRVAQALESGTVWINHWALMFDQFEEGGFKQSGQGRMRGLAVLDDFMEYKHISLTTGRLPG